MSETTYKHILVSFNEGIKEIIFNRPNKLNALNYALIMEVVDVLEKSMKDKKIRVIIIKGAGQSFCSGDDLESMGKEGFKFNPLPDESRLPHQRMIKLLRKVPKPIVALLHGYCLGAGFELALACDFRLASENLEIGDHRAKRAICMMSGASWFLPRIVGLAKATEITFTGRHLNASEALKIGLVNKVYQESKFLEKSREFIKQIAKLPTRCLGFNKMMINYSLTHELFPSLQNEFDLYVKNMGTKDHWEGKKSFLEKRQPDYQGK